MPNRKEYKITCFLKKIFPVLYAKGKCFNSLCREPSTQLISEKLIFLRRLGTSLKDDRSRHQYSCPGCVEVFRDLSLVLMQTLAARPWMKLMVKMKETKFY